MSTGFIWHEAYAWHTTGWTSELGQVEPIPHVESWVPRRRLRNLIEITGMLDYVTPIKPSTASMVDVLRVHDEAYISRIAELSANNGGEAGEFCPFGRGSFAIALLAAGGVITAARAVIDGDVRNAYALVRPPGHHAEPMRGRGYCLLANVAIAVHHLLAAGMVSRVAIIDWDVHHGNGAQSIFWSNPDVLTISVHQDRLYPPDSGLIEELGGGAGKGLNINVPLPPGSGIGAYRMTFDRVIIPAVVAFCPDVIFVSCGFDASIIDPLGRMLLRAVDFGELTGMVLGLATQCCEGRVVVCHEGGYSDTYVPICGMAVLEELIGIKVDVNDPYAGSRGDFEHFEIKPHQKEVIDAVLRVARVG